MARRKIVEVQEFDGPMEGVTAEDYLRLDVDIQAPTMAQVLKRLGIGLDMKTLKSELKACYAEAAKSGITRGRLSARVPGQKMRRTLGVFDTRELRPGYVPATVIDDGYDGKTVGELLRNGSLDSDSDSAELEFRILPCAYGYGVRMYGGHRLEPVGLYYGYDREEQQGLLLEYQEAHKGLHVEYATPLELVVSAMMDREYGLSPDSDDVTLNRGRYRTMLKVPGGKDWWLCVSSTNGGLKLWWDLLETGHAIYCVVASVGMLKK